MIKQTLQSSVNTLKASAVKTVGPVRRKPKGPDELLGELFSDVQNKQIYGDGKTFVDLVPKRRLKAILQEYRLEQQDPNFDLREFVGRHFHAFDGQPVSYVNDGQSGLHEHITKLWEVLRRTNRKDRGSLLALPYSYTVPGGRFAEQFYWDSYFIMLGLAVDKQWPVLEGMMKNYTYMLRKFGRIPTANRSYFLSRSQPPLFAHMVELLAEHRGEYVYAEYLPYLLAEYRFWMKGSTVLKKGRAIATRRVVRTQDGTILNRFYDDKHTPRPESLREDVETAALAGEDKAAKLYLDLRAAAESGWDFSSRWFGDSHTLASIHTTDITPVDLNCLLYTLEMTIAHAYRIIHGSVFAKRFEKAAERRAKTIRRDFWSEQEGFFMDYNHETQQQTAAITLAGVFPLFSGVASPEQAAGVARRIEQDFLKPGGLVTTLVDNGQQWDAPNGWAPLQWITIKGLRRYGFDALADEIKKRWISLNTDVFAREGRLIEKYDVVHTDMLGGGGEYPLQDGFGWTNGVLIALMTNYDKQQR